MIEIINNYFEIKIDLKIVNTSKIESFFSIVDFVDLSITFFGSKLFAVSGYIHICTYMLEDDYCLVRIPVF